MPSREMYLRIRYMPAAKKSQKYSIYFQSRVLLLSLGIKKRSMRGMIKIMATETSFESRANRKETEERSEKKSTGNFSLFFLERRKNSTERRENVSAITSVLPETHATDDVCMGCSAKIPETKKEKIRCFETTKTTRKISRTFNV
jgi:uncharacterized protein (UPF0332 family)